MLKNILKAIVPPCVIYIFKIIKIEINKYNAIKHINSLPRVEHKVPQFIVTLTSYGKRVKTTAPYAICSILNQTVAPDRIILWLAHNTKIPRILKKLEKFGLEIKFCDDIKSYKKLIPALKEFPSDVLVTADDDILYPKDWFEKLKKEYSKDKSKIYCHRAHEIRLDKDKNILPYKQWFYEASTIEYDKRIFPTSGGGALYPPDSLKEIVTNEDLFLKLNPTTDDIWFWAMAKLNGTKHSLVDDAYKTVTCILYSGETLASYNYDGNENDKQLKALLKYFPEIKDLLL